MNIYDKVKVACAEKGTNVSALEAKLGFPHSSISKWKYHRPGFDKVVAVSDELGKPIDYFRDCEYEEDEAGEE